MLSLAGILGVFEKSRLMPVLDFHITLYLHLYITQLYNTHPLHLTISNISCNEQAVDIDYASSAEVTCDTNGPDSEMEVVQCKDSLITWGVTYLIN